MKKVDTIVFLIWDWPIVLIFVLLIKSFCGIVGFLYLQEKLQDSL